MPVYRSFNKDFFKVWSPDMAYVLGFIFADGNIIKTKRGTHFIAVYSADHGLLELIKNAIASEHTIQKRTERSGAVFRIQIGSKEWFADLQKLCVVPAKTTRMHIPDIPQVYIGDFVRGYFDGDGNVWSGTIHKYRKNQLRTLQVAFTSGSHEFLQSLRNILHRNGIKGGSLYRNPRQNYTRLSFSKTDALTIYKIMYNNDHKLYLQRKKQVFEQFVNCGGSSTG